MRTLGLFVSSLLLAGCSVWVGAKQWSFPPSEEGQELRLVKMLSWAEPAPESCDVDLEGSAPPARFDLRYVIEGESVVIDSDVDEFFAQGWSIVNRSKRGYGFEKIGSFEQLDFDIVEELRCECGPAAAVEREEHIIRIDVDWKKGDARPVLHARIGEGADETVVEPVTISGRLAMYDFRFSRPFPGEREGECSSRFLAALEFTKPLE